MKAVLFVIALVSIGYAAEKETVSTRATEAKGAFVCGSKPAANVVVRLVKEHSEGSAS